MKFTEALDHVLKHEGGFVDHPRDPGGMTNLGVTRAVWEEWVGRGSNEKEMRALTPENVAPLYKQKYWDRVKADDLPAGLNYCVFDAAVNSGTGRAAKWLQEAVGATPDGAIGPNTLAKVKSHDADVLVNAFCDIRMNFLKSLRTFDTFGRGWTSRVDGVRQTALGASHIH
jgi:lysozyme family protein